MLKEDRQGSSFSLVVCILVTHYCTIFFLFYASWGVESIAGPAVESIAGPAVRVLRGPQWESLEKSSINFPSAAVVARPAKLYPPLGEMWDYGKCCIPWECSDIFLYLISFFWVRLFHYTSLLSCRLKFFRDIFYYVIFFILTLLWLCQGWGMAC